MLNFVSFGGGFGVESGVGGLVKVGIHGVRIRASRWW